ncbi:hypothetical protein EV122DRAFT_285646 [Schizophyllum commune]
MLATSPSPLSAILLPTHLHPHLPRISRARLVRVRSPELPRSRECMRHVPSMSDADTSHGVGQPASGDDKGGASGACEDEPGNVRN